MILSHLGDKTCKICGLLGRCGDGRVKWNVSPFNFEYLLVWPDDTSCPQRQEPDKNVVLSGGHSDQLPTRPSGHLHGLPHGHSVRHRLCAVWSTQSIVDSGRKGTTYCHDKVGELFCASVVRRRRIVLYEPRCGRNAK